MDLGVMKNYMGFRYFLAVTDAYSKKIWAVDLKKKNKNVVGRALEQVIADIDSPITTIQSDMGNYDKTLSVFVYLLLY